MNESLVRTKNIILTNSSFSNDDDNNESRKTSKESLNENDEISSSTSINQIITLKKNDNCK